jgi:hypothetical protein
MMGNILEHDDEAIFFCIFHGIPSGNLTKRTGKPSVFVNHKEQWVSFHGYLSWDIPSGYLT